MHDAITQLSRIYWVAALRPWKLPMLAEGVAAKREVQTDLLPPNGILDQMPLSAFVRREIEPLRKLPEDWKEESVKAGNDPSNYHMYGFDER